MHKKQQKIQKINEKQTNNYKAKFNEYLLIFFISNTRHILIV